MGEAGLGPAGSPLLVGCTDCSKYTGGTIRMVGQFKVPGGGGNDSLSQEMAQDELVQFLVVSLRDQFRDRVLVQSSHLFEEEVEGLL